MRKHALVTGANGGFGRRVLHRLLSEGWRVSALVRGGETRLGDDPDLVEALSSGRLCVIDCDLLAYVEAGEALPLVAEDSLDALVNIAGTSIYGSVASLPLAEYRSLHRLNVEAPYLLVQAHLPALVRARGTIVQISSLAAAMPVPFYGPYAATKVALEAWSEALHHEVSALGVRVVCLQPGAYRTGVQARMRFAAVDAEVHPQLSADLQRFRDFVTRQGAELARDPDEVAERVVDAIQGAHSALRQPMGSGTGWLRTLLWLPQRLRLAITGAVFSRWVLRQGAPLASEVA